MSAAWVETLAQDVVQQLGVWVLKDCLHCPVLDLHMMPDGAVVVSPALAEMQMVAACLCIVSRVSMDPGPYCDPEVVGALTKRHYRCLRLLEELKMRSASSGRIGLWVSLCWARTWSLSLEVN